MFYSKTMSGEKTTRQFTPKTRKNTKHSHEMDIGRKSYIATRFKLFTWYLKNPIEEEQTTYSGKLFHILTIREGKELRRVLEVALVLIRV